MEAREILGIWWTPEDTHRTVSGTLKISVSGEVNLELNGSFDEVAVAQTMPSRARIFGATRDGQEVTLTDCICRHLHGNAYLSQTFFATTTFLGAHLAEADEVFDSVEIHLEHLREWVLSTGLRWAAPPQLVPGDVGPVVWVETPASETAKRVGVGRYGISRDYSMEQEAGQRSLTEDVYFAVTLEVPADLHKLTEVAIGPLRDLVTFGLDRPVGYKSITLTAPSKTGLIQGQPQQVDIELVRNFSQPLSDEGSSNPGTALFLLSDHAGGFQAILDGWFAAIEKAAPSLNILIGIEYGPPTYYDNRLILLLQAAEAYHRASFPDRAVHPVSLKNAKAALTSGPPEIQDWLGAKLRHATEPSLRARLSDLLRRAGPHLRPLIGKRAPLAFRLSRFRNLFSHHGAAPEAPDGPELYELAQKLHWAMKLNLLHDLGFTPTDVSGLVARNQNFQHLVSQLGGS